LNDDTNSLREKKLFLWFPILFTINMLAENLQFREIFHKAHNKIESKRHIRLLTHKIIKILESTH
jgi:hypothetical protein